MLQILFFCVFFYLFFIFVPLFSVFRVSPGKISGSPMECISIRQWVIEVYNLRQGVNGIKTIGRHLMGHNDFSGF